MLGWRKIYYMLLDLPLKFLVKSKSIPIKYNTETGFDRTKPMIYVLLYHSNTDLLTLRRQCLKDGLPDPLKPLHINGVIMPRYIFIYKKSCILSHNKTTQSILFFHHYIDLHRANPELDIKLIPVLVMFGRSPGKESRSFLPEPYLKLKKSIEKFLAIIWLGRDSFVLFSRPLSLRCTLKKHVSNELVVKKLIRVARIHFARQRMISTGPRLLVRRKLFNKLLSSKMIEKAIDDEARSKKISVKEAKKNAILLMEEIAANFSYEAIRFSDRVLRWTWNRLYQGLHVRNINRVIRLAERGHAIVYAPCHRSHMDYLLLSYVLYNQGLVPPHIAAGSNLNFWPIGLILRHLGAFFIRRTFKGNKLYSTIFREYLGELFLHGYSVEYFIEGRRSRTGRLLEPKTGTLTMTIQTMLRGISRPISIVPIYVGYEKIMEESTYARELRSGKKKKESLWQILSGLIRLRNLGQSYVIFGDPISLSTCLSKKAPQWRHANERSSVHRPSWLSSIVNDIATILMIRINNNAVANAINLCSMVLLSSRRQPIARPDLLVQLACYLDLLHNVPYAPDITVPDLTPEALLTYAISMNIFTLENNNEGNIYLSYDQTVLLRYYRNNIQHLFILPSLVSCIICGYPGIAKTHLYQWIMLLYPLLKAELFLRYNRKQLLPVIDNLITELIRQGLVETKGILLFPSETRLHVIRLLASDVNETLYCYAITFLLLQARSEFSRSTLEKESWTIAKKLSILYNIDELELLDKTVFSTLAETLRIKGYISDTSNILINERINKICEIFRILIKPDIFHAIKNLVVQ